MVCGVSGSPEVVRVASSRPVWTAPSGPRVGWSRWCAGAGSGSGDLATESCGGWRAGARRRSRRTASRLALARDGYVWIVRVADGSERRLVRGGAPAWSPNGRQIAYHRTGRRGRDHRGPRRAPTPVGAVRGTALDWQPMPGSATRVCRPPARVERCSHQTRRGRVSQKRAVGFFGCLRALGRTRRLLQASTITHRWGDRGQARGALRGARARVGEPVWRHATTVTLYDLGSGKATPLARSTVTNWGLPRQVGLPGAGLERVRGLARDQQPGTLQIPALSCPSVSLCVAGDVAGRILSSSDPAGGAVPWSFAPVSSSRVDRRTDLRASRARRSRYVSRSTVATFSPRPPRWRHRRVDEQHQVRHRHPPAGCRRSSTPCHARR